MPTGSVPANRVTCAESFKPEARPVHSRDLETHYPQPVFALRPGLPRGSARGGMSPLTRL